MEQSAPQAPAAAAAPRNALLSAQQSSDAGLQVVLHPLVLITISDYIVRHGLREQQGPVVGALLGQQNGRELTLEFAFECRMVPSEQTPGDYALDETWFLARLEQMRTVHKDRGLDFVGWYTMVSHDGPSPATLNWHKGFLEHNESAVLLGFHPSDLQEKSVGGKLPLTIYESNLEVDDLGGFQAQNDGEDKEMKEAGAAMKLKFRELPFSVETGEAEMISMNFVASATSATAAAAPESQEKKPTAVAGDVKGKRRAVSSEEEADITPDNVLLSKEEEETIAALTAKANAIKMMDSRLKLLITYLKQLPPSFVDGTATAAEASAEATDHANPSHTILRSILALVSRLSIVEPSDSEEFNKEMRSESNNVGTVSLLNDVLSSISDLRDIGKKYAVVETARSQKQRVTDIAGGSGGSGLGHPFNLFSGDVHHAVSS